MNVKCLHERLQEFVANLETTNRVFVKRKLQRCNIWKTFSENKKFHECLTFTFSSRAKRHFIKKKGTKFFIEKSHDQAFYPI